MNKVLRNLLVTVLVIILIFLFTLLIFAFPAIVVLFAFIPLFLTLYLTVSDFLDLMDENLERQKREKLFRDYYYNKKAGVDNGEIQNKKES